MVKLTKPKKIVTNTANNEHKLSPLEKELLGYYKDHQPVLLYGEDNVGRKNLILNVHKANGGLDQNQEYSKDSQEFEPGKSTERTCDYVNLALFDNSEIYHYLATTEASDPSEYSPQDFDEKKTPYDEGFLYCCKGLLFLDNLLCSDENKQLSYQLDVHINDRNTSFQWLVIYAEKLDGLSQCFMDQFKLIPLDGERTVSVSTEEIAESREQEVMPIETTLSYDKNTGKFRFGNKISMAVSRTPRSMSRPIAEELMKWWMKGEPCPQHKIVLNPERNHPQSFYDSISTIRSVLLALDVNMQQCAGEEYQPPREPKCFNIEN